MKSNPGKFQNYFSTSLYYQIVFNSNLYLIKIKICVKIRKKIELCLKMYNLTINKYYLFLKNLNEISRAKKEPDCRWRINFFFLEKLIVSYFYILVSYFIF